MVSDVVGAFEVVGQARAHAFPAAHLRHRCESNLRFPGGVFVEVQCLNRRQVAHVAGPDEELVIIVLWINQKPVGIVFKPFGERADVGREVSSSTQPVAVFFAVAALIGVGAVVGDISGFVAQLMGGNSSVFHWKREKGGVT